MNSGLRKWHAAGTALLLFCFPIICPAAVVTRGPYLQQGTSNSMIIRWRTDVATTSAVGYGVNSGSFTGQVNDAVSTTNHIVSVSNLDAETKYFYRIGTTTSWFTTNTNNFFITAPPIGVVRPVRIWALGDSGTADSEAFAVRDGYTVFNGTRPTDVWLMLGDNAYDAGTDAEYQAAVFNTYPTYLRNTVLWPAIGNHDEATDDAAPFIAAFTLPQQGEVGGVASGTERYYSFDYANIHFICLDSASSTRTTNGPMYIWARADLEATTQEWIIAYWHHPPYSKGSHNSDTESGLIEMRQNFNPLLEQYGVDLVLCGHSHGYERSYFLDGHYGLSTTLVPSMKKDGGDGRVNGNGAYQKEGDNVPHQGTVYTVAGSSGQTSGGTYNHPAMYTSQEALGSAVIDVFSNRLDLIFLRETAAVGDYFTIIKAPPTPPPTNPPVAPTNLIAMAVATNRIILSWTDNATDEQGFKMERSTNGVDFTQFGTVGAGVTNATNSGLLADSTYQFRVRAYNVAGDSDYSEIAQATTFAMPVPDTAAPAAVTNLIVSAVTSNSVTLSWIAPGDDGNIGTAASYDVRYRTNAITSNNWASSTLATGEPAPLPAGSTQSFTINGLVANRTYFFALRSSDEVTNISQLSVIATITTPPVFDGDDILPARVTNLTAVATTSNSVTLSWRAPGDDGNAGTASSYDVRYRTNTITSNNWTSSTLAIGEPIPTLAGTTQFFTVTGLTSVLTYFFALRTSDETNNISHLSNVASGTTTPVSPPDTNAPAAITNLIISALTSNTVTLSWTAPGDDGTNGTAASYDVRYRTNAITSNNWASSTLATNEPAPLPAGSTQSFSINGLAPNRTYFFAMRSADETNNISQLSIVVSATTLPIVPPDTNAPAAITNLAVNVLSATVVTLSWTAPGDDGTNGTAASYDVRYRTNAITSNNWSSSTSATGEPTPLPAGTTQSFNINGLTPNRTYFFAMRSSDESNNLSQLSNVASDTTPILDTIAPAAITNLSVSTITSNSVTLLWIAPGDDGSNGTAASYDVRYRTNAITSNNWASSILATNEPVPLPAGATQSLTIDGLTASRTYFFAMRSSDEATNISSLSSVVSATTLPVVPPDTNAPAAVTDLIVSVVSPTTVTLWWSAPGDDGTNGAAASYDVRYRTNAITSNNWATSTLASGEPAPLMAGTTQSFNINGLTPNRTYYFALRASDESTNISQLSNVASGNTPALDTTNPATVTNLVVSIVNSNTVMLSWTAPGDDGTNGLATIYDVRWRTNFITASNWATATQVVGEPTPALPGTVQSVSVTGLAPSRSFYFALRTSDEATNVSPISNVPDITMPPVVGPGIGIVTLIPSNAVWKYLDNGSNQGTNWRAAAFNDVSWTNNGPAKIGYGGVDETTVVSFGTNSNNKFITTYFRRHFDVGDPSVFSGLSLTAVRDDGVVVYLNGNEVFRDNMPTGLIANTTIASSSISGTNRSVFYPAPPIPASHLLPGDNVVAAEVHLRSASSSTMGFNLELKGTLTSLAVQIGKISPDEIVLHWPSYPGKRYRVLYSDDLPAANWANAEDILATGFSSTATNAITAGQQRFYRVQLLD